MPKYLPKIMNTRNHPKNGRLIERFIDRSTHTVLKNRVKSLETERVADAEPPYLVV